MPTTWKNQKTKEGAASENNCYLQKDEEKNKSSLEGGLNAIEKECSKNMGIFPEIKNSEGLQGGIKRITSKTENKWKDKRLGSDQDIHYPSNRNLRKKRENGAEIRKHMYFQNERVGGCQTRWMEMDQYQGTPSWNLNTLGPREVPQNGKLAT